MSKFDAVYKKDKLEFSQGTEFNAENAKKVIEKYGLVDYYYGSNISLVDVPRILKTGSHRTHPNEMPLTLGYPHFDHPIWFRDADKKSYLTCHSYISDKHWEEIKGWCEYHGLKCETIDNWYGFDTTAFIVYA